MIIKTSSFNLTDEEFLAFCLDNKNLRIERDSQSNIIIMSPVKDESSGLNSIVHGQLFIWNMKVKGGLTFESSAGFTLSNNAVRSPDVSWIEKTKFETAKREQKNNKGFLNIVPDFVVEIKSESDSLKELKEKMHEYLDCGVMLGYLIIPEKEKVLIYQSNREVIEKKFSEKIIADNVVTGFELDLSSWKEMI
ncbi:MAG: Uma2 family endonuclease [Bacteroidia bacterium]